MQEPAQKKILYWCESCNIPIIGKQCSCGEEGRRIPLLAPYDVRPALSGDMALIMRLLNEKFGDIPLPDIVLLNKTGGIDRTDLVIVNGERLGYLSFDPVTRKFSFDIAPEGYKFILPYATKGILSLEDIAELGTGKQRIGGKRFPLKKPLPDGNVTVKYRARIGSAVIRDGSIKIREINIISKVKPRNASWIEAVEKNRYHLKNLERNAIRTIKHHIKDRDTINVSFSGGKDSTAVLHLARAAGVTSAFFIDTGLEFPETLEFIRSENVQIIPKGNDFWQGVEKAGPPGKDHRWCCKLLKLFPLKVYLSKIGPCVTVQGNRWYESWNRAGLDETSQNPANPLQLNISPIRSWRALEVFMYLWWKKIKYNPLYEKGLERIGCYLCPAMLESEYELLKTTHPKMINRWEEFLNKWAERKGYPSEYIPMGLWRWKALPPKMREICKARGIEVLDDFTIKKEVIKDAYKEIKNDTTVSEKKADKQDLPENIRKDFPILGDFIYLDNAATSFSPEPVVNTMVEFEHHYRANVGRGVHRLTNIATQRYWHAHEKVSKFIDGDDGTTVFVKNTTEAINIVAKGLSFKPGDKIITSILEHHSNLLPWRALSEGGVKTQIVPLTSDYLLDLETFKEIMDYSVKLVSITHASNALGVITPVKEISEICNEFGALLLVDGSQSIPHIPISVKDLNCDFFCFSGHKLFGPTGTGVLWMKNEIIKPLFLGGGMVESVTDDEIIYREGYERYEAGTPNIGGGIALGTAIDYINKIGMPSIREHDIRLTTRLIEGLTSIDGVKVYACSAQDMRIGVVSFTLNGLSPHEVAGFLDENADILVRSGVHCCQPLMNSIGCPDGTVRVGIAPYTTNHEIDLLISSVKDITKALN